MLAPVATYDAVDGLPTAIILRPNFFAARSGGAGLVLTEPVAVSAGGRITPGDVGLYRPDHATAWEADRACGA